MWVACVKSRAVTVSSTPKWEEWVKKAVSKLNSADALNIPPCLTYASPSGWWGLPWEEYPSHRTNDRAAWLLKPSKKVFTFSKVAGNIGAVPFALREICYGKQRIDFESRIEAHIKMLMTALVKGWHLYASANRL